MQKKIITFLTSLLLMVLSAFTLASCNNAGNKIVFKTLSIEGTNVYGKVSNATAEFSFADEIEILGNVTYEVSSDKYGSQTYLTKTVPLAEGDNFFYIFEIKDEQHTVYEVTLRRRPMYTVSFNTNGGDPVASQTVEEDSLATKPETQKMGYTFSAWDYDFSTPITSSITINANWTANTYPIFYDLAGGVIDENANPATYTPDETIKLANPQRKNYAFLGWYNGDTKIATIAKGTYGELNLAAKWEYALIISENCVTDVTDSAITTCHEIEIPDGVTSIGNGAFRNCSSLTSIIIPDGVTSIGSSAFENCNSLTSITIPDSVASIGFEAFYNCSSLQYTIKDNLKYLGNKTNPYLYLASPISTSITTATIDTNCKFIGENAFRNCSSLTSIESFNSVISIGNTAFTDCSNLTNITLPDKITFIGEGAFAFCISLTSITIPDKITSISASMFYNCSNLKSIEIPKSVTFIDVAAFRNCSSLTSITIPDGVTLIGPYVFSGCSSLTSITIPDSVTSIDSYAFYGCSSLTSITIPDSVTSIDYDAFYKCNNLTIYCEAESEPSGWQDSISSSWNPSNRPVYWYSKDEPTTTGNYWHYDENGKIEIWE